MHTHPCTAVQNYPDSPSVQTSAHQSTIAVAGTLTDFSNALNASGTRLQAATQNALDLLAMSGHAVARGDTADDLKMALVMHLHLVQEFNVRVRSAQCTCEFSTCARTSFDAYDSAAKHAGEDPCAISVRPAKPSREDLQRAHRLLGIKGELDDALKNPSLSIAINRIALKPMFQRAPLRATSPRNRPLPQGGDFKRFAANDRE